MGGWKEAVRKVRLTTVIRWSAVESVTTKWLVHWCVRPEGRQSTAVGSNY